MDIKDCHIGQKVRVNGYEGIIVKIYEHGTVKARFEHLYTHDACFAASDLTPVSDPCSDCQTVAGLHRSIDAYRRNAAHWRSELTKLQNEALECKPMSEVAKIYIQVSPDKLLMSQEARRVIEYLKATDCPVHIGDIMDGMEHVMSCMAIMDGLIAAREAGIVRLDDGKYSIVRD